MDPQRYYCSACARAVMVGFGNRDLHEPYGGVYVLDVSDDAAPATYKRIAC